MNKKFLFRLGALVLSCVGFISLLWGGVLSNVANVKADDSVSPFYLLVSNGTGSGYFAANQKTTITAFPAASTIAFDRWVGDTSYLADVNSASTTVTMPSKGISVIALYKSTNPATYLTVNNGTGSGYYGQGAYVTIEANPSISEKVFDKWTGDTAYVADVNSAKTRVTMPNKSITVTATYKDSPAISYVLTVNSGTGSGSYVQGKKVTIEANPTIATKIFDKWTGDTTYVADVNSASTTVTMPAKAITVTATYKDSPATSYVLTVKSGTGTGSYVQGKKVTIVANPSISEKVFDKWTGDTTYVADVNSASTTVTMPAKAITVTATYKPVSSPTNPATYLTVNNGTGSGSYGQGAYVTIEANPTIATKLFDKWTGDTAYIADVNSAKTRVTMPNKSITVTATYKTQPAGTYVLAIKNGAGSGFYVKGQKVTIVANAAANGKIFDRWTGATSTNLTSNFIASVTSSTTVVTMPGVATTLTATYKDSSIKDGSMIRLKGGADVYIVKYSGGKWYKRLILSPSVFKSYGHLKWSDIIDVDAATMDSYITSNYVYVAGDSRIWLLEPAGDTGKKTQVTSAADPDSVYEINATDRDSYATTAPSTN